MSLPRVLISFLAVLIFGAACISLPDIDSAQEDAGTPVNLTVNLLAPSGRTFTNGTVNIQVQVTGGTPDKVELLVDDQPLTTLSPPYTYKWSTTSMGDGSHRLTVKATSADTTFLSEAREVVVDRTPPQIVSRTPAPGDQNVWSNQFIEARFSEPIQTATVSDTSVRLTSGQTELARTLSLTNDAKALSIVPSTTFDVPSSITVTLASSITDLAGNTLMLPTDSWTWNMPSWLLWGAANGATTTSSGSMYLGDYQLDEAGRAVAAWHTSQGGAVFTLQVKRWENGEWKSLGSPLGVHPETSTIRDASLILDASGAPIVAWSEPDDSSTPNIHVRRWSSNQWEPLGNALNAFSGDSPSYEPRLRIDPSGAPVIAWSELTGSTTQLCLRRWQNGAWKPLGDCMDAGTQNAAETHPVIRFDRSGRAVLAWISTNSEHFVNVYRLEPNGWQALSSGEQSTDTQGAYVSMQIDGTDNPVISWSEFDGTAYSIHVQRWRGDRWDSLGAPLSAFPGKTNTWEHYLQVDAAGRPVIAWGEESSRRNFNIRVWSTDSWQPVDGFTGPDALAYGPGLGLHRDNSGSLLLTWSDGQSPSTLRILRQNR